MRALMTMILASCAVGCGPRVSQWIRVTDCAPPHAVVPNARVFVQEIVIEEGRERPHDLGHVARGGNTNERGQTWDSFSTRRRSVVMASVLHADGSVSDREAESQPLTRIGPDPRQQIEVCVHRYAAPP